MTRIIAVGELAADGTLTKLSTEVATLGRALGEVAAADVVGVIHGARTSGDGAAAELGRFVATVLTEDRLGTAPRPVDIAAALSTMVTTDDVVLLPASPNGRDIAGTLSGLTGLAVLTNATAARWSDEGPIVEMSAFGGRLITESAFTSGRGIITVRPNAVTAVARDGAAASIGLTDRTAIPAQPAVQLVEAVAEEAAAVSIDDARIIVSGGRGVGGAEGFALVSELAAELGGAVGATRAAVDSGWIPYAQQIGQTGKIVKPGLYLALGISGAIQHKVGMQTAGTIIAINRDPDAPIAGFADMFVVGDLFEVGPALLTALRARRG